MAAPISADLIQRAQHIAPASWVDWLIIAPVVVLLGAAAVLLMVRRRVSWQFPLLISASVIVIFLDCTLLLEVRASGPMSVTMGNWRAPFGITFTADLFGALMVFLSAFIGFVVSVYAMASVHVRERRYGFCPLLAVLLAGVHGAFLTGDIFNLYVWFEVMLIASFGLFVLGSRPRQLDGAVRYAFLNLFATALFLIATGGLYGLTGTLNIADLVLRVRTIADQDAVLAVAALYGLALAIKAAAFPVNFWLPAAYHTPRIVVSAIFAALLTKVGVYALIRIYVMVFADVAGALRPVIVWIACLTMLTGALGALAQSEVRRLLNYLVIVGIGAMLSGLALGSGAALAGSILYMVHSMVVMAGLYLCLGIVEQVGGSGSLAGLRGLYERHPVLATQFFVFACAIAGLPPLSGMWPKIVLVRAALTAGGASGWAITASILLSSFLVAIAIMRVWLLVFWRSGASEPLAEQRRRAGDGSWSAGQFLFTSTTVFALAALVIVIGLFPGELVTLAGNAAGSLQLPGDYIGSVLGNAAP